MTRRFELHRHVDVTGVSGDGVVAEGIEFTDGSVVLRWRGEWQTTVMHPSMASVDAIHGHHGNTTVCWIDDPDTPDALVDRLREIAHYELGLDQRPGEPDRVFLARVYRMVVTIVDGAGEVLRVAGLMPETPPPAPDPARGTVVAPDDIPPDIAWKRDHAENPWRGYVGRGAREWPLDVYRWDGDPHVYHRPSKTPTVTGGASDGARTGA